MVNLDKVGSSKRTQFKNHSGSSPSPSPLLSPSTASTSILVTSLPEHNVNWRKSSCYKSRTNQRPGFTHVMFAVSIACLMAAMFVPESEALTFRGEAETYAMFPKWDACANATITFDFKTRQPNALLMYTDDSGRYDYLQVALTDGAVHLWMNFVQDASQEIEIELGKDLNDGRWHRVEVKRNRMETMLLVDDNQQSKVGFSGDTRLADLNTNNFMYFGGIPLSFRGNTGSRRLPASVLGSPFVGELRNVLYFNCTCIPTRVSFLELKGAVDYPREACDVRNPCDDDCPCISGDDYNDAGCMCDFKRECLKDFQTDYLLPMDRIERDLIVNPSGLDSRVYGQPQLVSGVQGQALQLEPARQQWVRVAGPGHREECFGDLETCAKGYYLGMWLHFDAKPTRKDVYLSNGADGLDGHGVAMSYSPAGLEFVFKTKAGQEWIVTSDQVQSHTWQHVAASWDKDKGLYLYINGQRVAHTAQPRSAQPASERNLNDEFILGRSNDRNAQGQSQGVGFKVDNFHFASTFRGAEEIRGHGAAYHIYMPMDEIRGGQLVMTGGQGRVTGPIQTIPGRIRNAISFPARGSFVDLGDSSESCLGNLEHCHQGIYISFFIRFNRLDNTRGFIFSSPIGLNVYQQSHWLMATAQSGRQRWDVNYNGLETSIWHYVEVTWSDEGGLMMYLDGNEVGTSRQQTLSQEANSREKRAFLGRSNRGDDREMLYNAALDNVEIYFGAREMLQALDFIPGERPTHFLVDFEDIRGSRVVSENLLISLAGNPLPTQTAGKVGRAIQLRSSGNQAVDFGDRTGDCLGNLDLCNRGVTFAMWLRPSSLIGGATFLSTSGQNGITLVYKRDERLHAIAQTSERVWATSTSAIHPGRWYYLEVSYSPRTGLTLYINNDGVAEDLQGQPRTSPPSGGSQEAMSFYLGRPGEVTRDSTFADATFDELEMWYADRDYLVAHGYIQRSQPQHYYVHFEDLLSPDRLAHDVLNIRLVGRPQLVPGKVSNALELTRRGQYADLGRRGSECFSNLQACTKGILISAWMKFERFENNMVFLSTGENGLLMVYRNGYIQITASGRGMVSIPRFDLDRWYFVELAWHPDTGLKVYVDNELKGESPKNYVAPSSERGSFKIGHPNQGDLSPGAGRYATGDFLIDELEIWYDRREYLMAFGYITRGHRGSDEFRFDDSDGSQVIHGEYQDIRLINGARLVSPGYSGSGRAVQLAGNRQFVDMGEHFTRCLGNIDKCSHGVTISIYLNPTELRSGQTFLAAPTHRIYYQSGMLKAEVYGTDRKWLTETSGFEEGAWQRVTLAWHPMKGQMFYLNDELVDTDDQGVDIQRGWVEPPSKKVYIGRALDSDRITVSSLVDQLQVWYDDIDQLRATGQYRAEVQPYNITFNDFRDEIVIRGFVIKGYGNYRIVRGRGQSSRAVYLDARGRSYIDLGQNFTCGGDMSNCQQGVTLRLGLRPRRLRDGQVFYDSYPMKLWFQNGRLYGQAQTATQLWRVETTNFRPNVWQRVELSWHPRAGLALYVDGRREASQVYAAAQREMASDWNTFVGRALEGGLQTYADTDVDSIELWMGYRDSLPGDEYLRIPIYEPPTRPPPTVAPRTTPRNPGPVSTQANVPVEEVTYLIFDGKTRLAPINLGKYKSDPLFFTRADTEVFTLYFSTTQRDGLIWLMELEGGRTVYLALRDGYLLFVNDDGRAAPEVVYLGEPSDRFFDGSFHKFKLDRDGRKITLTVNDKNPKQYMFSRHVQFLTPTVLYLGSTDNTAVSTKNRVTEDFVGTLAKIDLYTITDEVPGGTKNQFKVIKRLQDNPNLAGNLNIIVGTWDPRRPPTLPPPTRPATPQPPRLSAVTLQQPNVYIEIQKSLEMDSGNTLNFKFRTTSPQGLLLFTTDKDGGPNFAAIEIYDGKLYFVHKFGTKTRRTLFSEQDVSDGQTHEVQIQFDDRRVELRLDGLPKEVILEPGELLPQNLGFVYLGRYTPNQFLPWHMWSNTSYQGCIFDVQIDGDPVDFYEMYRTQLFPGWERECQTMQPQCIANRCGPGICTNTWNGYVCDCSDTDYSGFNCRTPAWTALFDGKQRYKMSLLPQKRYNINNISFRFRTMAEDGLIFQTQGGTDGPFIRAELVDGMVRVTTNLGREITTFDVGENLNDMDWHTLYIKRRGKQMEVWVDKGERQQDRQMKILPGENFHLYVDNVLIGGHLPEDNLNIDPNTKFYVGYLRNFYFGGYDVFDQLQKTGEITLYQYPNIPPLIFNEITLPTYDSYIRLNSLESLDQLNLHFQFKTNEPNGLLFFNEGFGQEVFAVDMFEGQIYVMFSAPGKRPVRRGGPPGVRYDDGKWHSVSIVHRVDQNGANRQLILIVDNKRQTYSYTTLGNLQLQGDLYVGGIPSTFYEKSYIKSLLYSKSGYRGCLASVFFGRSPPDLRQSARVQGVTIYDTCKAIITRCTEDSCDNGGICHDHRNNGTTYCDCTLTGFGGPRCSDHPLGFYFRSEGDPNKYGMMVYTYPKVKSSDSERDEIVFGVMTEEMDATLVKLLSGIFKDFIEIKLVDGYLEASYDTDGEGTVSTINNGDVFVSDGDYHIVRFIRTKDKATLFVDDSSVFSNHQLEIGNFDRLSKIFVGGRWKGDGIETGTGYWGIVGGLNVNGHYIFDDALAGRNTEIHFDVIKANTPYTLEPMQLTTQKPWEEITSAVPPLGGIPILPSDIGGAGIAWTVGAGGVVDTVVFPGGSAGSGGVIPGGAPVAADAAAAPVVMGSVGSLPAIGPRAGALMGTLLGLALLATSLMWAFYRCKPGWCGGAGGGGGPVISAPHSASNIGAVNAAAANSAAAAGGDADLDSPDTALLTGHTNTIGAANGGSATYFGQSTLTGGQSMTSAVHQRADSYDSSTLRAMGTFSNRGTALGTPGAGRHQFNSTSGYSESNMLVTTPGSMQSYQIENSNPDYDIAAGVHGNAGGFSSSTMSSNYNYSVKTIKTVGGQQQLLGYNAGSLSNVIVTPGAMGEEVRVDCCLMTNDGHSVVTGSSLGPPQVWNMSNGELLRIMQGETVGSTYLHLVNGDRLLVGAINSDLEINQYSVPKGVHNYVFQIWDFATGRPLDMAERETLSALTVMNEGDKVVFGRSDKFGGGTNIIIWDLLGNQPIKEMRYDAPVGNNDYISFIAMSQNDRYVIAGFTNTFDNFAEFVLLDTALTSYSVSDPNILRLDANPDCTAVLPRDEAVTGLRNGDLVVWSIKTGQPSRQLLANNGKHAHSREVKAVARSQDNKFLVSASADGTLKLWDLETERHISTMSGHNDEVWCCAISDDNEIVVSGSRDGTIRLWRLRNGQEICAFNAGVDVFYITMSHDKGTIVALGDKYGARKLIMLQVVRSKVKRQVPV